MSTNDSIQNQSCKVETTPDTSKGISAERFNEFLMIQKINMKNFRTMKICMILLSIVIVICILIATYFAYDIWKEIKLIAD